MTEYIDMKVSDMDTKRYIKIRQHGLWQEEGTSHLSQY